MRYSCDVCGSEYNESKGLPDEGVKRGTKAAGVYCPECRCKRWVKAKIAKCEVVGRGGAGGKKKKTKKFKRKK